MSSWSLLPADISYEIVPQISHQNGLQHTPCIYLMSLLWLIVNLHNGDVWAAAADFLVFNTHSLLVSNYVSASHSALVVSVQSGDGKLIIAVI